MPPDFTTQQQFYQHNTHKFNRMNTAKRVIKNYIARYTGQSFVDNHFSYVLFVMCLLLIYSYFAAQVERLRFDKKELIKELNEQHYEYISIFSDIQRATKPSNIDTKVQELGLTEQGAQHEVLTLSK
ncbi:MAG: hypothetical protein IPL35_06160 [Sphingobacteriales bacterium]|nr:hypothetical protein [Sphingobacteriales bacterium]